MARSRPTDDLKARLVPDPLVTWAVKHFNLQARPGRRDLNALLTPIDVSP